jgi:hypothetical protein
LDTLSRSNAEAKAKLEKRFSLMLTWLFGMAEDEETQPRDIELKLWKEIIPLAAMILGALLSALCRRLTCQDLQRRGLNAEQVHLRRDKNYWTQLMTTFGKISFPLFAYRDLSLGAGQSVTRTPAREAFPYHRRCRSSALCLEWEVRLGSDHPFRQAQDNLEYYTHGAVCIEDTTIVDHMLKVSELVDRSFLYRTREQIIEILRDRATRDRKTERPLLFMSSDAHAGRRYIDDTWEAVWKMANGIRLWCEDRHTGRLIHIGGEFTWGDCNAVREALEWLIEQGLLPTDGNYGDDVSAQLVWVSDGMPWFETHLLPLFTNVVVILDAYHLLDRMAKVGALFFGKGTKKMRNWYNRIAPLIHGRQPKDSKDRRRAAKKRKGIPHRPAGTPLEHAHDRTGSVDGESSDLLLAFVTPVLDLMKSVASACKPRGQADEPNNQNADGSNSSSSNNNKKKSKQADKRYDACVSLVSYIIHNCYRINYPAYRQRGYQIGSGAMEAMHRTGSQVRVKVSGARWLPETSQAVFNFRMMRLAERWDDFWSQPDLPQQIADTVRNRPSRYPSKKSQQPPDNPNSNQAEEQAMTG